MALVHVPTRADHAALLRALLDADAFSPDLHAVTFRFAGGLSAGALAYLATWGRHARERGVYLTLDGEARTLVLLDQLGLTEAFGRPSQSSRRSAGGDGQLSVRFVDSGEDVFETTNAVLDLVVRASAEARAFLPALDWVVNETIDNVQLHAEALVPGAVCARYDDKTRLLDIGIADVGMGVLASLGSVLEPWDRNHGHALSQAVQRGVTRDPEVGQGNGLAGAREIALLNGGAFTIWSGNAVLEVRDGQDRGFSVLPGEVPGTGVSFQLDLRRPVDLADTFMGAPAYTFLEMVAEWTEEAGGLRVADEVSNTGTRAAARALRNKALNLLPDLDGPLVLDFEGVERATSSFLDELLGRMADMLGPEQFHTKVRPVNLHAGLLDLANVVVAQRLGDAGTAPFDERER